MKKLSAVLYALLIVLSSDVWGRQAESLNDLRRQLATRKDDPDSRVKALLAIAEMGKDAQAAIPDLLQVVRDASEGDTVRRHAGLALEKIGGSAVPGLTAIVEGEGTVDARARIIACNALGGMDEEAREALPVLVRILRDKKNDAGVRDSAAGAIGEMDLRPKDGTGRYPPEPHWGGAAGVGYADYEDAIAALTEALNDPESRVRATAAFALGEKGADAERALPKLLAILRDRSQDAAARKNAAAAIGMIGVPSWESIRLLMEVENEDPDQSLRVVAADSLKTLDNESRWANFLIFLQRHSPYSFIAAAYLVILLVVLALFWLAPLWLLRINELLARAKGVPIPWLGGITLPVRYLFLIGFFQYSHRVLNAWVTKHVGQARDSFASTSPVTDHEIYVPITVGPAGEDPLEPAVSRCFEQNVSHLLIFGEGGIGKTNLAIELGRRAMEAGDRRRLCPSRLMIPVVLEPVKGQNSGQGRKPVREYSLLYSIQSALHVLINKRPDRPSPRLIKHLLKHRRLLLIIDSFSEMEAGEQAAIISSICEIPANAVIFTSRRRHLGDLRPAVVTPPKLMRSNLNTFVDSYLDRMGKAYLFTGGEEFQDACSRLTVMLGKRPVTVLHAKLFIEQLVAVKEGLPGDGSVEGLPQTVPDLMVNSIRILNRHETKDRFDTEVVIVALKAIAWKCMEATLTPRVISFQSCLDVLRSEEVAAELLRLDLRASDLDESKRRSLVKYLDEDLGIIKVIEVYPEFVRFTVDPLSEYLACLHLLGSLGDKQKEWSDLLSRIGRQKEKSFALTLMDCCLSKGTGFNTPDFVVSRLGRLIDKMSTGEAGAEYGGPSETR